MSETFIAHELAALERRGLRFTIVSLRQPYDRLRHPVHQAVRAPLLYLPEYLYRAPGRVLAGHRQAWRAAPARYRHALRLWWRDLVRDPTPNRVRRFGQAGVLAAELGPAIRHFHAHFLHTPASVARYAAVMLGATYSLSGHAKDIWTRPDWELGEKLAGARFAVTCTAAGRARLEGLAPGQRVELIYHGLDRTTFPPPGRFGSLRDGRDPADPVRLLSVGRFESKKGFDLLLRALARLSQAVVLTIVGYGAAEARLRGLAGTLGVAGRVRWAGQLAQPAVRALYRESDVFVLAARVAADGNRDGLPNVVVEALSQGVPVVATAVGALPELVHDGVNGRLVPPDDPAALADALAGLVGDPESRRRLGAAALAGIAEGWDVEDSAGRLAALLAAALAPAPAAAALATAT